MSSLRASSVSRFSGSHRFFFALLPLGIMLAAPAFGEDPDLARVVKTATDAHIAERDVTKAIFEGRIKISLQDLKAASLAVIPCKDMNDCIAAWNRRFGAIAELNDIQTIVENKEVRVSGKDLLLRLSMRLHKFEDATGLDNDPALTYTKAVEKLSGKPGALQALDTLLQDLNVRNNAWTYFQYLSPGAFNLSRDYQAIQALTPEREISESRRARPNSVAGSLSDTQLLNTAGLQSATFLNNIHDGQFTQIKWSRTDGLLRDAFKQYIDTFGASCTAQLPDNRVEILQTVCTNKVREINGAVVSETCKKWETRHTGIYADPRLYAAYHIELTDVGATASSAVNSITKIMTGDLSQMRQAGQIKMDVKSLFRLNNCKGAELNIFGENFMHFLRGEAPVQRRR